MAGRIILRISRDSQLTILAVACQVVTLAALVGASLIIVWTAELFR